LDENDESTHSFTLNAGEELTVKMCRTGASMLGDYSTAIYEENDYPFYYSSVLYDDGANEAYSGETISFDEPGTYYLWADGGYGEDYPEDIVSSPAYAIVEVLDDTPPADPDAEAAAAALAAAKDAIDAIKTAAELTAEEAAAEAAANAAAAAAVDARIDTIGTVTLESADAITAARNAYNALNDAQKALVTKLGTLAAAESTLSQLQAAAQEEKPSDNDQQSGRSFWDKILDFFRRIISFFQNIFKR
jgi:hypothetical protein